MEHHLPKNGVYLLRGNLPDNLKRCSADTKIVKSGGWLPSKDLILYPGIVPARYCPQYLYKDSSVDYKRCRYCVHICKCEPYPYPSTNKRNGIISNECAFCEKRLSILNKHVTSNNLDVYGTEEDALEMCTKT